MHRMAVYNQKHLAWHRAHQAAQKVQKHLGGKTPLEYLKAQGAEVGQAGDDIATKALPGGLYHWAALWAPSKCRTGGSSADPSRRPSGFGPLPAGLAGAGRGIGAPSSLGQPQGTVPEPAWLAFAAIGSKHAGSDPRSFETTEFPTAAG